MEFQADFILSEEIKETMKIMPGDRTRVSPYLNRSRKPMQELRFRLGSYFERHKHSDLVGCWSSDGIELVFCPSDHTGVWTGRIIKGVLGKRTQAILETIAKEKHLI